MTAKEHRVFWGRVIKMFRNWLWWWIHNYVTTLKPSDLCTFSGSVMWYMNDSSIKLLKIWTDNQEASKIQEKLGARESRINKQGEKWRTLSSFRKKNNFLNDQLSFERLKKMLHPQNKNREPWKRNYPKTRKSSCELLEQ